ncbi:MAG: sulfurtransferase TusA family protein [Anaerolineales bacterium]|nr:sulfurtransferase TusA family protein [Anaerolineales bacterium]
MSAIFVDARGLSCPQPVILAHKAISEGVFPVEVTVDTVTSRENVRRMAEKNGCKVEISQQDDEFTLVIKK